MPLPPITKEDVDYAARSVREDGIPAGRRSTKFCLVVHGHHLPPKYVLALAAKRQLGRELRPDEFAGGAQTNDVLTQLGFHVVACSCGGMAQPFSGTSTNRRSARPPTPRPPSRTPPMPAVRASSPRSAVSPTSNAQTTIVRIVAEGRTPAGTRGAEAMLLEAFGRRWPRGTLATFTITPGGFVRTEWPDGVRVRTGWDCRPADLEPLRKHAERVLGRVVTDSVLRAARERTAVLTIGIDVLDGPDGIHAELVAVYDVRGGKLVRWTGKSYPTPSQEQTLVHAVDLDTHLIEIAGERALVLGCHDLNMFSPRGRANQAPNGLRRKRCDAMKARVAKFRPTVVLQHPHSTDTPNIWRLPWLTLAKEVPSIKSWASGLAYFSWNGSERADLPRVLELTKSDDSIVDIVLDAAGYG